MEITKRDYWDYKAVEEVLDFMDFELLVGRNENDEIVLKVRDLQGANLGDIESDEFYDFVDLMDRFDIYYKDYFEDSLLEEFESQIGDWNTYSELYTELCKLPPEETEHYAWDIQVIGLIGGAE